MTSIGRNTLIIILLVITGVIGGGMYFAYSFFSAFAPDKITISETEIKSSGGFINPVTIEQLRVDSFDKEQLPVKYIVEYLATCGIKQEPGKPPVPLKQIKLNEPGRYSWTEEIVHIPIIHEGLSRRRTDSLRSIVWSMGDRHFDICPNKFEREKWYIVTFLDPQIVGVFVYVDKKGNLHQYVRYSGVSPI